MQRLEFSLHNDHNSFPFEVCNLLLGKGGSGQVFLGRDVGTDSHVAIKKMYAKGDGCSRQLQDPVPKCIPVAAALPLPNLQGTQGAFLSALGGHTAGSNDQRPSFQSGWGEHEQLSQRRELDQGEESMSQMAALSQQSSKPLLESSGQAAAVAPLSPLPALIDEAAVLHHVGRHPQIVELLGRHTTSRSISYFAMELMDSDVARELSEGNEAFHSESVCVATAYCVLKALAHIHARSVAHRDVKPGNILLRNVKDVEPWPSVFLASEKGNSTTATERLNSSAVGGHGKTGFVKVALGDFSAAHGLSSIDEANFADTRGTLHYKAPEQLLGRRGEDWSAFAAVDLWGLGCTMYEMITGAKAFVGRSELQVLMGVLDALGSDIQSFPATVRPPTLFSGLQVSAPFVDLLQRLLSLDARARPTAKDALRHPLFEPLRRAESAVAAAQGVSENELFAPLLVLPIELKYASYTPVPNLRFSRICRPMRRALPRASADAPTVKFLAPPESDFVNSAPECASARGSHTFNTEQADEEAKGCADVAPWRPTGNECAALEGSGSADGEQHRSPDATAMSFMSESSYLHWSEIRPMTRPCALAKAQPSQRQTRHTADHRDRSCSRRAGALFSVMSGSTPSPSAHHPHRHLSESSRHPSASAYRNTVARALNTSDTSSVKVARTERSSSHVDFDLSPVAATQLFSAEADLSTCFLPHGPTTAPPRPPLPVLQLKSGSTVTASNLRANYAFERCGTAVSGHAGDGLGPAVNSFSTPRDHALQRTTAVAGRALCFSEEMDVFARRSTGSCPSQQSCLNSLLTSPAPRSRAAEGSSPQPSPIRPLPAGPRSPSGLPTMLMAMTEQGSVSCDDSAVVPPWISAGVQSAAATVALAEVTVAAAAGVAPPSTQRCADGPPPQAAKATPALTTAWAESQRGSCGRAVSPTSSCPTPPLHLRHGVPHLSTRDATPAPTTPGASGPQRAGEAEGTVRILPLPIPLSVAAGTSSPEPSRAPSHSVAQTPSSASLRGTPHTQRFPLVAAQRRSASAVLATPSSSPAEGLQPAPPPLLQCRDMNVMPHPYSTHLSLRGGTTGKLCHAGCGGDSAAITPLRAARVLRGQRHCTPSSLEPARENSTRATTAATAAPLAGVAHTPPPWSCQRAGGGDYERLRASTPRTGERGSHKRARDDATLGGPE